MHRDCSRFDNRWSQVYSDSVGYEERGMDANGETEDSPSSWLKSSGNLVSVEMICVMEIIQEQGYCLT